MAAVPPRAEPIRRLSWPRDAPRVGMHLGVASGLLKTAVRAHRIGCRALQIFSDNPTAWRRRGTLPRDLEGFAEFRQWAGIEPLVIHASYLINLAGTAQPFADQSRDALLNEMNRAALYGARFVNTHIGSHRQEGPAAGIERIRQTVASVLAASPTGVTLVLENSTGGGDELGASLEDLARILEALAAPPALGFCLDTAHLWGAGHDVSTPDGALAVIDRFDELIGLDRLRLIHLNDSKAPLGSRWDRHEHIGAGAIGPAGLGALLREPRLRARGVTFILETPGVDEGYDRINLRRARMLYAGAESLPRLPAAAFRLSRRSTRVSRPNARRPFPADVARGPGCRPASVAGRPSR